jgi:uncharacterized protein YifN (PemK superfamily)
MIKRRPAIVVSTRDSHVRGLCAVVPLSTQRPERVRVWHHDLSHVKVPGLDHGGTMWAKCDMVSTVSFERLTKPYVKTKNGRNFQGLYLDELDLAAIDACLRSYLHL